jgi:hypothetical protein
LLTLPMQTSERISKPQIISLFLAHTIENQKTLSLRDALLRFQRGRFKEAKPDVDDNRIWRRGPESNRTNRICNPGHNRFATAPEFSAL